MWVSFRPRLCRGCCLFAASAPGRADPVDAGGTFLFGTPESTPNSEIGIGLFDIPQHEITISRPYLIGKYEVTQAQWLSVMGTEPWANKDNAEPSPNHPANYVTWNDVSDFISRRNDKSREGLFRLPTEAEWEYACRAKSTSISPLTWRRWLPPGPNSLQMPTSRLLRS